MTRKKTLMVAVSMMLVSALAFAGGPSPHTTAVLNGTMHKTDDGKGYVLRVDSAKAKDGTDMPEMKGKEVAMPHDMSKQMADACATHCEKPIQVTCCIEDGKIAVVSGVAEKKPEKSETKD